MINHQEIEKKLYADLILKICGDTLDSKGYNRETYSFYLSAAASHQEILQSKQWQEICATLAEVSEVDILNSVLKNEELSRQITEFSQSIVDEVIEASKDSLATKLLKTSYLSILDRAIKDNEEGINRFKEQARIVKPSEQTQQFVALLEAEKDYLSCLSKLPFKMEALGLSIKNNTGVNYEPKKTTEMLANVLNTLGRAVNLDADKQLLIEGLKVAVRVFMPQLPVDQDLTALIQESLLPYITDFIDKGRRLETIKAELLPVKADGRDEEITQARKEMLAAMGVRTYTIQEILQETLIKPVQEFNTTYGAALGIASAANKLVFHPNQANVAAEFANLFTNFDRLSDQYARLDKPTGAPAWLNQANAYYQLLKDGVTTSKDTVVGKLGDFCQNLGAYVWQGAWNYVSQTSSIDQIFLAIDQMKSDGNASKAVAYIAFYELIVQGQITDPLVKKQFFEAYMAGLAKTNRNLKTDFEGYLLVETQLNNKFNLKVPLVGGIQAYQESQIKEQTNSLIEATLKVDLNNPVKIHILLLINRLQTLEKTFDVNKPQEVIQEITEAKNLCAEQELGELKIFSQEFLQPALKRIYSKYQQEFLMPLLEEEIALCNGGQHTLRKLYSKIKEEKHLSPKNLDQIEGYWQDFPPNQPKLPQELQVVRNLATLFGSDKPAENEERPTNRELAKKGASLNFADSKPFMLNLLKILQSSLDDQANSCSQLLKISDNQQVRQLARQKKQYILALHGVINEFREELNRTNNNRLEDYFVQLKTQGVVALTREQLAQRINRGEIAATPGQLMNFIWNVVPVETDQTSQINNQIFYNLLNHFFEGNQTLLKLADTQQKYNACLNVHPLPALMKELSDPLETANVIPSQEKIMDVIVEQLVNIGQKSTFSWGYTYLSNVVSNLTYDCFVKILPYPFFANLAVQAIQSDAVQRQIAPILDNLREKYVGEASTKLKEMAKIHLYPILGIEIQKTIETCAFNYLDKSKPENPAERDAFAVYYLKYRELRQNNTIFNREAAIKFLFPKLFADTTPEDQEAMIARIADEFIYLDKTIPYADQAVVLSPIEETNRQLQFLISTIDLKTPANQQLMNLTLINRLLLMSLEAADKLSSEVQREALQTQAIKNLSLTLLKIEKLGKESAPLLQLDLPFDEGAPLSSEQIVNTVSAAARQGFKAQLKRVKTPLTEAKKVINLQRRKHDQLLKATPPPFGLSVFEWLYEQSTTERKIFLAVTTILTIVGVILSWIAILEGILAATGALETVLVLIGLGAGATNFAIAIFVAGAVLCFLWHVGSNLFNHLSELKTISLSQASFGERIGAYALVVIKCVGLAFVQLFLANSFKLIEEEWFPISAATDLANLAQVWPNKEDVEHEHEHLKNIEKQLTELEILVAKQAEFLEKQINSETPGEPVDQSKAIAKLISSLKINLPAVKEKLRVKENDARLTQYQYQDFLDSYEASASKLEQEFNLMQNLYSAQKITKVQNKIDIEEPKVVNLTASQLEASAVKPIVVNLDVYREKPSKPQASVQNMFAWWSAPKPVKALSNEEAKPALPPRVNANLGS